MRLPIAFFLAAAAGFGQPAGEYSTYLTPGLISTSPLTPANASGIVINGAGQKLGWRFFAASTSPLTQADVQINASNPAPATLWRLRIYAESGSGAAGFPDEASPVSGETPEFTLANGTAWTGPKVFGTPTGNLTLNAPYWLVLYKSSGADPSPTATAQARHVNVRYNRGLIRLFNGTDWTTTSAASDGMVQFRHADGRYAGFFHINTPVGLINVTAATTIRGTTRHGMVFRTGAPVALRGVSFHLFKTGAPGDLELVVYEGGTVKTVETIPSAQVIHNVRMTWWFSSPPALAAATPCYVILRQAGNGGSANNDYTLTVGQLYDEAHIAGLLPAGWRAVWGTGDDPAALTTAAHLPNLWPMISDVISGLSGGGAAGGKWISAR